jgi:hypothetical protein
MAKEDSAKWTEVEEILQKAEKRELIGFIGHYIDNHEVTA